MILCDIHLPAALSLKERLCLYPGANNIVIEKTENSKVYGSTLDVVAGPGSIEVASGAMGPHPLDIPWGITDTWVGVGFGIERLLMTSMGDTSIGKWGKSLSYFNGIRL